MEDGPLTGLRVLDVSTILAGPLCCQILGDFGADVIKIEHPVAGDSMRGHGRSKDGVPLWWKEISRNKRTVGLDLVRAGGRRGAPAGWPRRPTCSSRTSGPARWSGGASAPTCCTRSTPAWSSCGSPASARPGPYAARRRLRHPRRGDERLRRTSPARPDGPPTLPAFGLADSICGIAASSATMMALRAPRRQRRRGPGRRHEPPRADHDRGRARARRSTSSSASSSSGTATGPPTTRRATPTGPRDGNWVAVSTSAQRIAERVLRAGRPPRGHRRAVVRHRAAAGPSTPTCSTRYVGGWIAERTRDEVIDAFERPARRSRRSTTPRDLIEDPHVRADARCSSRSTDDDLGPVLHAQRDVADVRDARDGSGSPAGALGADTDAVLRRARLRRRADGDRQAPDAQKRGQITSDATHADLDDRCCRRRPGSRSRPRPAAARRHAAVAEPPARSGTPCPAGTATWSAPTAARPPTT